MTMWRGRASGSDGLHQATQEAPVSLGLPEIEPVPFPECDVCAALLHQRVEARRRGDYSAVSDCNVEIAAHPHDGRR